MNEHEIRDRAFAMPLTQPAYPRGPYRFVDREYFIITYRTEPEKLRALVPAPLEIEAPLVKYEFIRMPDSTGFGDYNESGQVIPFLPTLGLPERRISARVGASSASDSPALPDASLALRRQGSVDHGTEPLAGHRTAGARRACHRGA